MRLLGVADALIVSILVAALSTFFTYSTGNVEEDNRNIKFNAFVFLAFLLYSCFSNHYKVIRFSIVACIYFFG